MMRRFYPVPMIAITMTMGALGFLSDAAIGAESGELIKESTVRAHMEFLASDALNGRGSGSRDEWLAATYIGAQMRKLGLKPMGDGGSDFVQTIEVDHTEVIGAPVLKIGALTLRHGEQVLTPRLAQANVSSVLVKYRSGVKSSPGATVLLPENAPRGVPVEAKEAALILIKESPTLHERWAEIAHRSIIVGAPRVAGLGRAEEPDEPAQAVLVLNAETYAAVAQQAERTPVTLAAETREVIGHTWNAAAKLVGSDPLEREQIILLTAHLDHLGARESGADRIFNGADDDASGSIAVMALAEALTQQAAPKRTVVFAWFGSEENGGYGARYFVQKPVVPLDSIVANLEFEMIGRTDPSVAVHTLWLTGWERTNLGPMLASHGAHLVADPHPEENFFARSDNIALARRGIVAQTVSSFGLHADYHQPSDDISHIDFAHMTDSIRSMLGPIRWLADSDFKPEWVAGKKP